LSSCRGAFVGLALLSGVINVLYLTGSFFMLEVYDRVIPSRSIPTLVGLFIIAFALYGFQGTLDVLRGRIMIRIGSVLDESLSARIFSAIGNARWGKTVRSSRSRPQLCRAAVKFFQLPIASSTGARARVVRIELAMMMPAVACCSITSQAPMPRTVDCRIMRSILEMPPSPVPTSEARRLLCW
jgi:hypothetical protein